MALEFDDTLGCLFLSGIFSAALWGASSIQLYFYYEKYSKSDSIWLRGYILLIWILDTAYQILLTESLYLYIVKNFTNLLFLEKPQRTLIDCDILAAIIDAMVQFTFVVRIWHLSRKNYILTGILSALVLTQFAITATYFGQVYHITQASELIHVISTERAAMIIFVVVDTIIALVLSVLLYRMRSGFNKRTDSIVKRLILYTISTGLITSLWGVVGLVGAFLRPNSFIYLLVDLVFPKLYLNCILASLNSRTSLRSQLTDSSGCVDVQLSDIRTRTVTWASSPPSEEISQNPIEVKVQVEYGSASMGRKPLDDPASQA